MLRLAFRASLVVMLVLVVAVIGAIVVVFAGPTEFGFVRDRIAATLQESVGSGYSVGVERAVVDVDPVLGLVVRVDNIDVRDNRQAVVAHVPSTRFAIDPLSLLRFRVDIREVELSGAEVSFVRTADGAVLLGDADTVAAADSRAELPGIGGFPDLFGALTILDRGIEPPIEAAAAAGFERFAMVNGRVSVWDAERHQQRRFPNTDLSVAVDRATRALTVNFSTSGFGGRWTATIERDVQALTRGHALSIVFSQLTLADLVPALGEVGAPVAADIPLYGRATMDFDRDGALVAATARLDLGAGVIQIGRKNDAVVLDEATLRLRWDPATGSMIVDPSPFFFGETRGAITGRIRPLGDPADGRYGFTFDAPGAIVASGDSGAPPMVAQRLSLSGEADFKRRLLTIDDAIIAGPEASLAAAGSVGFDGESPSLAMAASFSPMTVAQLKQIWIPFIAPEARDWVLDHVYAGRIVSGRFEAAVPAGMMWTGKSIRLPDEAMRLDLKIEDVAVTTFGNLPPITRARGNVVLAGSTFGVDFDSGQIDVPSGTVRLDAAAFAVSNLAQRPADGVIEVALSGSAQALAEIADADPLNALAKNKLTPADLSGSGSASISVRLPLQDVLTEEDIDWRVTVNTRNVASRVPVQARQFSEANVAMTVKPDSVSVYGKARIDGVPADVSMILPLTLQGAKPGEQQVRMVLDDQARKRLGVGLDQVISGTVAALIIDLGGGGAHYDLDLQRAKLTLDALGWSKPIGVPATLSFDLLPAGEGFSVANLVLKGDGFGFNGSATLDKAHNLVTADIERLALRRGDSIAIRLIRGRVGYGINARGTSFDLRGLIAQFRDRYEQSGGFPDLALDAKIDRVMGFNNEVVDNASLSLVAVGGVTQKLAFSGNLGSSRISADYSVNARGITLNAGATDLGQMLRFTDLYTRVAGGTVTVAGQSEGNGPLLGTLEFADFDVLSEPALQQALANSPSESRPFGPDRVHFTRMVAYFRAADRSFAVEDAVLRGPQLGAAFAGRYDARTTELSLTGTYIPLYPINNFFGQIPLFGLFLGAGPREGLFGVTFKIDGPIAEPHVFINPLSAVAPGIFRKIFDFQ
jgi:hypothetical protein